MPFLSLSFNNTIFNSLKGIPQCVSCFVSYHNKTAFGTSSHLPFSFKAFTNKLTHTLGRYKFYRMAGIYLCGGCVAARLIHIAKLWRIHGCLHYPNWDRNSQNTEIYHHSFFGGNIQMGWKLMIFLMIDGLVVRSWTICTSYSLNLINRDL